MIHSRQIKAARALLDWTGEDLANHTGLSVATIRNLEKGDSLRHKTVKTIRNAMEKRGIEFLDSNGVRLQDESVRMLKGADGVDKFFDELLQSAKEKNDDIVAIFKSVEIMNRLCDMKGAKLGRLEHINKHANIKCLLPDAFEPALLSPSFQVRTIMRQHIGNISYFIFGNKVATITGFDDGRFVFMVSDSVAEAFDSRKHFLTLWEMAPPVLTQFKNKISPNP